MYENQNTPLMRCAMTGMSDEQLAAIGFINVLWNGTERNLEACIWAAANWTQTVGEPKTADMRNSQRVKLLKKNMNSIDDTLIIEQSRKTLKVFEILRLERNKLMHGFFASGFRSSRSIGTLLKFTPRKKAGLPELVAVSVTIQTLNGIIDDLLLCLEAFHDLTHKLIFRQRFLDGERGPLAETYDIAVHGWREPSFDVHLLQACLQRRGEPNIS